jgi:ABC-type phosphate transport system substrate-binding protein
MKGTKKIMKISRAWKIAGVAVAAAAVAVAPAMASLNNTTLDGKSVILTTAGSDTTFGAALNFSRIYNELPGCDVTVFSGQATATYGSCTNTAAGSNTFNTTPATGANPQHDSVVDEFPIGSGSGAKLVGDANIVTSHGLSVDLGRSSSTPATTLNAIAFAKEGVSWFHFTKVAGKATAHTSVTNLTPAQLADVYSGTFTTWNELAPTDPKLGAMKAYTKTVDGKVVAVKAGVTNGNPETDKSKLYVNYLPLVVYSAQDGSGTRKMWDGFMTTAKTGFTLTANAKKIFENNADPIVTNGDAANAIFYFSTARYAYRNGIALNSGNNKGYAFGNVSGNSTNRAAYTDTLGNVNDVAPTTATIKAGTFSFGRFLFFSTRKVASASVKNYVRFLCSADMDTATDAYGATIRPQIDKAIQSEGFIKLDLNPADKDLDGNVASTYCKTTLAK